LLFSKLSSQNPEIDGQYEYVLKGIVGVHWLIEIKDNKFTYYMTGESKGLNYDKGKVTRLGDTLVFDYTFRSRREIKPDTFVYNNNSTTLQTVYKKRVSTRYRKRDPEKNLSKFELKCWKATVLRTSSNKWRKKYYRLRMRYDRLIEKGIA